LQQSNTGTKSLNFPPPGVDSKIHAAPYPEEAPLTHQLTQGHTERLMNSILCNSSTAAMSALGDQEGQDIMVTSLQELKKEFGKKFEEQEKKLSYLRRKLSKQGRAKTKMMTSHNLEDDDLSFGSEDHDAEANETIVLLRKEQKESFAILENDFQTLRARVEAGQNPNMNRLGLPAFIAAAVVPNQNDASSDSVNQDSDTDNDLLYKLPEDTFTLMMVYNPLTPAWNIGVFSFAFQMLLLILIWISQVSEGDGSTPFNVPFKVTNAVRIGQFAVIFLCLLTQDDVLTSLQSICALWKCDCTAFLERFAGRTDPNDPPFHAAAQARSSCEDRKTYALHIFLPNLLKFIQGVFVLAVSWVIVAQGENLIDLLKDSTALFFVSAIDNVIFFCANTGYFGQKVGRQAQATTEEHIVDGKKWSFKARSIVVIIIGSIMIIALSHVAYEQVSGNYFALRYPNCIVGDESIAISKMMNGICDGGELNTLGCDFDGGDCINHNLAYPGCDVEDPEDFLGNDICDGGLYNTPECKYDNGDCIIANYTDCHSFDDMKLFGDGVCHLEFNTASCGNDKGDCDIINRYPNCDIPDPNKLGDGTCDSGAYDTILCGFDGGDCVDDVNERVCKNSPPGGNITQLGDGKCNARNNKQRCSWDGKDCLEFNAKYPSCRVKYKDIDPERVGDGICDNFGGYNSLECGNDGSDCSNFNLQYPECEGENPDVIGDGNCDPEYDNAECGFDGFDCFVVDCNIDTGPLCTKYKERFPDCPFIDPRNMGGYNEAHPYDHCDGELNVEACNFDGGGCKALYCLTATISALCDGLRSKYPNCALANGNAYTLGNFECDPEFNTLECGWDTGDCVVPNYPDCHVDRPERIGDGRCYSGAYNTAECGFDGGDCDEFNAKYPNCTVDYPDEIGDGVCNGGAYNTIECGFEDGDCEEFNANYPNCSSVWDPSRIGDGYCDGGAINTIDCGWDGGDCEEFNANYPNCTVDRPGDIGDGSCNGGAYNTTECGFDAGDCVANNNYPDCYVEHPLYIGSGNCQGGAYNTIECGFDGGDCKEFNAEYPNCNVYYPTRIGDEYCDGGAYNTIECGFDAGDCVVANYPDCRVEWSSLIGDGRCEGGAYNTIECGFEDGDCEEFNTKYPNCSTVDRPEWIGDEICDGGDYNTIECGFDGGDCDDFNAEYPECNVDNPSWIGNRACDGGAYNTIECGFDAGACVVTNYPDCRVDHPEWIGDGSCNNWSSYNTAECGFDAGDCEEFNTKYPN
jgi:hypothetical protein